MRARENSLWRWLDKFKHPMLQMTRVESQDYPDVSGCFDGCAFLIALKSVGRSKTGNIDCELTTAHAMFLRRRWRVGGLAFVLVHVGGARYLVRGCDAGYLTKPVSLQTLDGLDMLAYTESDREAIFNAIKEECSAQTSL